jgi:3-methylcrotonyl-CoA carboxylase alpha subunit
VRARLREAALVVARAIGYVSAGTVEFLFDGREFYFMEMNTRLQVEHTVTEAITGLDLVEWQLRVASGEPLPLAQEQVSFRGHAIEARVCAEDPERGFLPSAGRLQLLEWPEGEGVRVDAGFASGDSVPDCYDSLLGKVIAWGEDREQAAARLAAALGATCCAGVHTNERWLARILRSERFLGVRHDISLLDQGGAEFAGATALPEEVAILAALAAHGAGESAEARGGIESPWEQKDAFTPNLATAIPYTFRWRGVAHAVSLEYARGRPAAARIGGAAPRTLGTLSRRAAVIAASIDGQRQQARYLVTDSAVHLWTASEHYELLPDDPRTHEFAASAASGGLTTPLPGVVVAVPVSIGQQVAAGEVLMVIEAMKMEHTITAPHAGTVASVHFARGDRVPEGAVLLALAQDPPGGAVPG